MVGIINKIQDPVWRAFVLRIYNTLVAAVIALIVLVAGFIIVYITSHNFEVSMAMFTDPKLWDWVMASTIISILTSIVAGSKKAERVEKTQTVQVAS